jgi:hypothetical protein
MIAFTCHAAADEVHHRIAGLHQGRCELTSIGYTGGRARVVKAADWTGRGCASSTA